LHQQLQTLYSGLADTLHEHTQQSCPAPESDFQILRVIFSQNAPHQMTANGEGITDTAYQ